MRLFSVEVDGVVFGLIDESDSERGSDGVHGSDCERGEHVELYPNQLGFYPPWNGEYDT